MTSFHRHGHAIALNAARALSLVFGFSLLVSCGRPSGPAAPAAPAAPVHGKYLLLWESNDSPSSMRHDSEALVHVSAKNSGDWPWPNPAAASPTNPTGMYAVRLAYRWLREDGSLAGEYPTRADLPVSVPPGGTATFTIKVIAPPSPGKYQLQFDLVEELVTWFEGKGNPKLLVPVTVE
ncbi:MAG: hypothetical protein ABIT01_16280 [Thermoanaerobaculia bacterium]